MKLRLKDNIQKLVDEGKDIFIRLNGRWNRQEKFPHDTPKEDYEGYRKMGFRIFVCEDCGLERCSEDCKPVVETLKVIPIDKLETKLEELKDHSNEQELSLPEDVTPHIDLRSLSLMELRDMYPNIKSVSKEGFIKQINEL